MKKTFKILILINMLLIIPCVFIGCENKDTNPCAHTWCEYQTTPATCDENGIKISKCSNCNETKEEILYASGQHNWYIDFNTNTCTTNGIKHYKCYNCSSTKQEIALALGHDWNLVSYEKETCTSDGVENYTCLNCTETKQVLITANGHNWYITNSTNATCTTNGIKYYNCSNCSETKEEINNTSYGHYWYLYSSTNATCTSNGLEYYKCYNCIETKQETILAFGHDMSSLSQIDFNPTCNIECEETIYCANKCGHTESKILTIENKATHEELSINDICSSCGYKCIDNDESSILLYDDTKQKYCAEYYGETISNIYNNYTLTAIYISNNTTAIIENAFKQQSSLKVIKLEKNSLLETIGSYAFYDCNNLKSLDLSNCTNLTSIGVSAFEDCGLININLSNCINLLSIFKRAFYNSNLTSISLNNCSSLSYIGDESFYSSNITAIDLSNNTNLCSIGYRAFLECGSLTTVNLSNCTNLTDIREGAFWRCSNLSDVNLKNCINLKTIGLWAFLDCRNLTSIDLSDCINLNSIGSKAFFQCYKLTNLNIPSSLISLGDNVFTDCNISFNMKNGIKYIGTTTNPYLIAYLAKSNGLTTVVLNEDCKIIADDAFSGCSYLEYIIIPKEIKSIGNLDSDITKYYLGSSQDWESVYCCGYSYCSHKGNTYFYIENEEDVPTDAGNYWHYDTEGITPIIW